MGPSVAAIVRPHVTARACVARKEPKFGLQLIVVLILDGKGSDKGFTESRGRFPGAAGYLLLDL
jgi:hypothetical protein